ncbi:MAG TPA: SBBP repeat-containing protein [Usitatibacteraceae bacterium]
MPKFTPTTVRRWLASAIIAGCTFPAAATAISDSYGNLPLYFERNQGQAGRDVEYLYRGSGYGLFLTAKEAMLVLAKPAATAPAGNAQSAGRVIPARNAAPLILRMALAGATPAPPLSGLEELPGKVNYFIGKDPSHWQIKVPTYAKVRYLGVYPGIDLIYRGNQRQLEYDFVLAPGADPKRIALVFQGARRLEIDEQGALVLHVPGGEVRLQRPVIYQLADGKRQEIAGDYKLKGANQFGFQVAAYDHSRPLVIDPVLSYSTYLGGSSSDYGAGIAVDASGSAYVTGWTASLDFPVTGGSVQTTYGGDINGDVFVTKLSPDGSALVYSTYLGGADYEYGSGIAVDAVGNAYVTGYTQSNNFPVTAGAFQTTFAGPVSGGGDAFVTKLDPTGSVLVYSTYLGGSGGDLSGDASASNSQIALDAGGNAYIIGSTRSIDFPVTPGAFQTTHAGVYDNAFVTKLNATGSALVYSTYLGMGVGRGIAVDNSGNTYVVGSAQIGAFPTTAGSFQPAGGGGWDAFVTKLDAAGSTLIYSTLLGGSDFDEGTGIALDACGNAYVTGYTRSADFPTTLGAFQVLYGGTLNPHRPPNPNAFVAKLNAAGSALAYSTYLGGSGGDVASGISIDAANNAYVTGTTFSTNFPTTLGAFQPVNRGGSDLFVTKLHPTGAVLVYSSYLGGGSFDYSGKIGLDGNGNAYVTGWTVSKDFPTTAGVFQPVFRGILDRYPAPDAFVAKIIEAATPLLPAVPTVKGDFLQ